jgi:hypothetical protein
MRALSRKLPDFQPSGDFSRRYFSPFPEINPISIHLWEEESMCKSIKMFLVLGCLTALVMFPAMRAAPVRA